MIKLDFKFLLFALVLIGMSSCEDVIEVETPQSPPRLAIDALVRLDSSEPTTTITVKSTITSSFFETIQPTALDEIVLTNSDYVPQDTSDENFIILSEVAPGIYEGVRNTGFFTNGQLELSLTHQGDRYLATTTYVESAPIDSVEQGESSLFSEDDKELKIAFTDNGEMNNFYLFDFGLADYLVTDDGFYQGQTFNFSYFIEDGEGRTVAISLLGVDEPFFNYMNQLIAQSGGDQGPFQTPAATVRGNIVNITDSATGTNTDNFALGYFAVCETFQASITLE